MHFDATIRIEKKELDFETFKEIIKNIKIKKIYKYAKHKDNFLKIQLIAQLIEDILKELNINIEQEFNKKFHVSSFKFINKGTLKLQELEEILDELKKKNYQIKSDNHLLETFFSFFKSDLYDYSKDIKNKEIIERYFPNIQEIEEKEDRIKGIHTHYKCDGCGVQSFVGIRYNCKTCKNFDYCENCMEKNIKTHKHEFNTIEKPDEDYEIPILLQFFYFLTEIKPEFNYLKGIFFYQSSKDNFELDIIRIHSKLLNNIQSDNNKTQSDKLISFLTKKLPIFCNLLLCYDDINEDKIYSFCIKAINCYTNNLFFIVRPEELKIEEEKYFLKILNKLLKKKIIKLIHV